MDTTPCPKCKSRATHVSRTRGPYMGIAEDLIFSCRTCGMRVYGPEKVNALVAQHQASVQAVREREERLLAEEKENIAAQQRRRLEELAREAERLELGRKREEAKIFAAAKCAWPPCPNDHTMTSKYCSRVCKDRNAHANEKARKMAQKLARANSPDATVSP